MEGRACCCVLTGSVCLWVAVLQWHLIIYAVDPKSCLTVNTIQ